MPTRPDIVVLDEGRLLDGGLDWNDIASSDASSSMTTPGPAKSSRGRGAQIILTNKTADRRHARRTAQPRFISVLATGYNVVDTEAARARGIPVSNVPSYGTDSVAQHVLALILELCNRVGRHADMVAEGHWANSGEWCAPCTPVVELHGLRLGLLGRGRIARRVAEIGRAFGMEVVMASTSHRKGGEGLTPLDEVVATSDIVSLHCQLNGGNRGMVDAAFLARMKPTAFLVNTARGALINEPDLAAALAGGTIAGAALDVLSVEPPPADHPLFRAPNCLITPHMAWMGPAARKRLISITVENVRAFLAGSPVNVVNA